MGWSIPQRGGKGKAGACANAKKALCKIKVKSLDFAGFSQKKMIIFCGIW
jgi:hypothetical protein